MQEDLEPSITPCCGKMVNAATHIDDDGRPLPEIPPKPDIHCASICAHCGEWLVYIDDHNLRLMTSFEREHLKPEMRWQMKRASAYIKRLHESELLPGHGKSRS